MGFKPHHAQTMRNVVNFIVEYKLIGKSGYSSTEGELHFRP